MIQDNQKNFSRLQMLIDAIVIAVTYVLAWMIRFIGPFAYSAVRALAFEEYMFALIFIIPGYLLLIQSALSHFSQHGENKEPYSPFCKDVDHTENVNRQSGEIRLSHHIQTEYDQQKSEYICLDDICQNQSAPLHMQRLI